MYCSWNDASREPSRWYACAQARSVNTVRRVMDVLRNVLRLAVERRYIAANPCAAVKMPKKGGRRRTKHLAELDEEALSPSLRDAALAQRVLPGSFQTPIPRTAEGYRARVIVAASLLAEFGVDGRWDPGEPTH